MHWSIAEDYLQNKITYKASRNVCGWVFLWCVVFLMRSMGSVITWRLWVLKNEATFSSIRLCLGLALTTSKILPLGNVFAIGWYMPFKERREAGTRAILSNFAL